MAGRPRKMLAKAEEMQEMAYRLADTLGKYMPSCYRERIDRDDPWCRAWQGCAGAVIDACESFDELCKMLETKAGITPSEPDGEETEEPGPDNSTMSADTSGPEEGG